MRKPCARKVFSMDARLAVAAILALSAVRASGPKDDLPAAFFHPLPGACFPADAVTASVSVPGSLFRAWPAARGPPQWRLLLNGREAAGGALDGGGDELVEADRSLLLASGFRLYMATHLLYT